MTRATPATIVANLFNPLLNAGIFIAHPLEFSLNAAGLCPSCRRHVAFGDGHDNITDVQLQIPNRKRFT
jgi:hypothetical protein